MSTERASGETLIGFSELQKIGQEVHQMGLTDFTYWFEFRERLMPLLQQKFDEIRLEEVTKAYWEWKSSHEECGGYLAQRKADLEKKVKPLAEAEKPLCVLSECRMPATCADSKACLAERAPAPAEADKRDDLSDALIDLQSSIERLESGADTSKVCIYLREDLARIRKAAAPAEGEKRRAPEPLCGICGMREQYHDPQIVSHEFRAELAAEAPSSPSSPPAGLSEHYPIILHTANGYRVECECGWHSTCGSDDHDELKGKWQAHVGRLGLNQ